MIEQQQYASTAINFSQHIEFDSRTLTSFNSSYRSSVSSPSFSFCFPFSFPSRVPYSPPTLTAVPLIALLKKGRSRAWAIVARPECPTVWYINESSSSGEEEAQDQLLSTQEAKEDGDAPFPAGGPKEATATGSCPFATQCKRLYTLSLPPERSATVFIELFGEREEWGGVRVDDGVSW